MPVLHFFRTRATDSEASILQHFYIIAAVAIVLALFTLRVFILRRRHQALSNFFRLGETSPYAYGSYPPYDATHGSMIHGIQLARPAAVYHPDHRVRAADVDSHGRRLDSGGEEWEGKDTLPAYDNHDRPPKYVEAGWSPQSPPPPAGHSAVAARSEMTHPDTANTISGDIVGQPLGNAHAAARVAHHDGNAPPAFPTHDDHS